MLAHLNPFGKGRLPRRKDFWLRTRISVFSFWVRRLQHLYRRYAYYDSINLGTVRITHSCRDEIFEGWLKALGQDVRPHMTTDGIWEKEEGSKPGFRPFYRFFEFKRQLLVNYRGKELLIDRSSQLTVDNEINGLSAFQTIPTYSSGQVLEVPFANKAKLRQKRLSKLTIPHKLT